MSEAWMVRAGERQKFLQDLEREMFQVEEIFEGDIEHTLAGICIRYLENSDLQPEATLTDRFFFNMFLPKVLEFSRAPEEIRVMVGDFLERLVGHVISRVHSDLSRKEREDPRTIFHADSAMSQI